MILKRFLVKYGILIKDGVNPGNWAHKGLKENGFEKEKGKESPPYFLKETRKTLKIVCFRKTI